MAKAKIELTPTNIEIAKKALISHGHFYYCFCLYQEKFKDTMSIKDLSEFDHFERDFPYRDPKQTTEFLELLTPLRFFPKEQSTADVIKNYFDDESHRPIIEFLIAKKDIKLPEKFTQKEQEEVELPPIQRLIKNNLPFYLNFAFFYKQFQEWITHKSDPELLAAYNEMHTDFWEALDKKYENLVDSLLVIRKDKKKELGEIKKLFRDHPKLIIFLIKYKKSIVIEKYNEELSKSENKLDDFLDKVIEQYNSNKKAALLLRKHLTFYIKLVFFLNELKSEAGKGSATPLTELRTNFLSQIPEQDLFVYALEVFLTADEEKITEKINELLVSYPKLTEFVMKHENHEMLKKYKHVPITHELVRRAIEHYENEVHQDSEVIEKGRTVTIFFNGTSSKKSDYLDPQQKNPMYGDVGETISYLAYVMRTTSSKISGKETEYDNHIIIDGPGSGNERLDEMLVVPTPYSTLRGIITGAGTDENIRHALCWLKGKPEPKRPIDLRVKRHIEINRELQAKGQISEISCVNIVGWSRGADQCVETAYKMAFDLKLRRIRVNLFLIDQVPGPMNARISNRLIKHNVKHCYIFLAQDERSGNFEPIIPRAAKNNKITKFFVYSMPGAHPTLVCSPHMRNMKNDKPIKVKRSDVGKSSPRTDRKFYLTFHEANPALQTNPSKTLARSECTPPHISDEFDLSASGLLIRDFFEKKLRKHGTQLFLSCEKAKQELPKPLNLTLKQKYALYHSTGANLAGYRFLQTEVYVLGNNGKKRAVTVGYEYTFAFHSFDDIPEIKSTDEMGNFLEQIAKEYHQHLDQIHRRQIQIRKNPKLILPGFHLPNYETSGPDYDFYKKFKVTPYEYLEIEPPSEKDLTSDEARRTYSEKIDTCKKASRNYVMEHGEHHTKEIDLEAINAAYVLIYFPVINPIIFNFFRTFKVDDHAIQQAMKILATTKETPLEGIALKRLIPITRPVLFLSPPTEFCAQKFSVFYTFDNPEKLKDEAVDLINKTNHATTPQLMPQLLTVSPGEKNAVNPEAPLFLSPKKKLKFTTIQVDFHEIRTRWNRVKKDHVGKFGLFENSLRETFERIDKAVNREYDLTCAETALKYLKYVYRKTLTWFEYYSPTFHSHHTNLNDSILRLQNALECTYYYKKLGPIASRDHDPMVQLLHSLKSFIQQKIDDGCTSTTMIEVNKIIDEKWRGSSARQTEPFGVFIQCRKKVSERLDSTVSNFIATHGIFNKRAPVIDEFFELFAKTRLIDLENESSTLADLLEYLNSYQDAVPQPS